MEATNDENATGNQLGGYFRNHDSGKPIIGTRTGSSHAEFHSSLDYRETEMATILIGTLALVVIGGIMGKQIWDDMNGVL